MVEGWGWGLRIVEAKSEERLGLRGVGGGWKVMGVEGVCVWWSLGEEVGGGAEEAKGCGLIIKGGLGGMGGVRGGGNGSCGGVTLQKGSVVVDGVGVEGLVAKTVVGIVGVWGKGRRGGRMG